MKKALVLFSGGRDSLLSTVRYLDNGYIVYLVTYENFCGIASNNALKTAKRLVKKYGENKVILLGIKNITSIFRNLIYPFYTFTFSYILEKYGNISISQFNCLACRTSMYIATIILSKQYNIKEIVDGARKSQLFIIEQKEMLDEFRKLFTKYDLIINFPLENMTDDWELKNELLIRGIIPKTIEPQCLFGCPISIKETDEEVIKGIVQIYKNYLLPKVIETISKYKDIKLGGEYI